MRRATHARHGCQPVGLDGNSVVVLSRDGVLVFDSNGTPAARVRNAALRAGMSPVIFTISGCMDGMTGSCIASTTSWPAR